MFLYVIFIKSTKRKNYMISIPTWKNIYISTYLTNYFQMMHPFIWSDQWVSIFINPFFTTLIILLSETFSVEILIGRHCLLWEIFFTVQKIRHFLPIKQKFQTNLRIRRMSYGYFCPMNIKYNVLLMLATHTVFEMLCL